MPGRLVRRNLNLRYIPMLLRQNESDIATGLRRNHGRHPRRPFWHLMLPGALVHSWS
jgi:hypothetical protein